MPWVGYLGRIGTERFCHDAHRELLTVTVEDNAPFREHLEGLDMLLFGEGFQRSSREHLELKCPGDEGDVKDEKEHQEGSNPESEPFSCESRHVIFPPANSRL